MSERRGDSQTLIVTHAVLTGLTPLIPVPIVDDLVKTYFQRRLVRELARTHGVEVATRQVEALADDPPGGCSGCLGTILTFPLKLIFRKLFFFLEWKRAIDTVTRTYYHGYLINYTFQRSWFAPAGPASAEQVRGAVDQVLKEANTSLIEQAARQSIRQSMGALRSTARMLQRSLSKTGKRVSDKQVEQAVEQIEEQKEDEIKGIAARLQRSIEQIPADHFEPLETRLAELLGMPNPMTEVPSRGPGVS